jgi:hypothetical protein
MKKHSCRKFGELIGIKGGYWCGEDSIKSANRERDIV